MIDFAALNNWGKSVKGKISESDRALGNHAYCMSEKHLSGYRLVIGFDTLKQAQDAHQAIADAGQRFAATQSTAETMIPNARYVRLHEYKRVETQCKVMHRALERIAGGRHGDLMCWQIAKAALTASETGAEHE